jgi:hypothetical protein
MKGIGENRFVMYPVLLAWFSVVSLAAVNIRTSGRVEQYGIAIFLAAVVGVLAWLLSGLLTRDIDRRSVMSLLFTSWFVGHSFLVDGLNFIGGSTLISVVLQITFLSAAITFSLRAGPKIRSVASYARTMTVILFMFPVLSIAFTPWRGVASVSPMPPLGIAEPGSPNVFLIVLDKYTGSRSLLENHAFDNRPFKDRLRSRGFVVPRASRSNYPHTRMTLATMLNWTHLDNIRSDSDAPEVDILNNAIEDNRTWRFFRERGYEFIFLPSTFTATQYNRFADRQIPDDARPVGVNIGAAWILSTAVAPVVPALRPHTIAALFPGIDGAFPYPIEDAKQVEAKFMTIAELASEPGPLFLFAHLLVPHEPYIFDADCTHRSPNWPRSDFNAASDQARLSYIAQLQCVNRMVENLVDLILARSAVPPIILLQSDHGHGFITVDAVRGLHAALEDLRPSQLFERSDIFSAYYLPGDGDAVVYDSITPINVLPSVLNHYFDANIPLQEDAIYWGALRDPFQLQRIRP